MVETKLANRLHDGELDGPLILHRFCRCFIHFTIIMGIELDGVLFRLRLVLQLACWDECWI